MRRWETLDIKEIGIYQDDAVGCFTEDALLLARFASVKSTDRVLDVGTGNGVIAILCQALTGAACCGIDIDERQIALARASSERNGQPVGFDLLDAEEAPARYGHGSFTACLFNPPYYSAGDSAPDAGRAAARHISDRKMDALLHAVFLLLKNGGRLYLCYPAERLADIVCLLRKNRLEPKRIRIVFSGDRARLLLIESKKLGKKGLRMER